MSSNIPMLVISGSLGSGKTTVLSEASDLLAEAGICHGAIDLDWLTIMYTRQERCGEELMFANLAAIRPVYKAAGAPRLLVTRVVEDRSVLQEYNRAVPGAEIIVCYLRAPVATMQERLHMREPGLFQTQAVARCAEVADILEHAGAEDFTVNNGEGRHVTEVAREMLIRAGWL